MGTTINALKVYSSGSPKNQSIILIHGFPFDHTMWENQIQFFKEKYFCITYDVRGLGNSSVGDGQYTLESFVDDLEIIIDELKLNKPVLCGLSMGGYIALRALERMQAKFKASVLFDTRAEADTDEGKLRRAAGIKMINQNGAEQFVTAFLPNCFSEKFMNNNSDKYHKILRRSLSLNPIAIKGCLLAMSGRTDTTNSLPNYNIPVLVLCGENDKLTPPSVMKAMAEKIPESEFEIVPNAAHISPIENAEFVNLRMQKFLSEIVKL